MERYLSVDSGGTKVAAILYDENFSPVKTARVGSMRETTVKPEMIRQHVEELIEQLGIQKGMVLKKVAGASYGDIPMKERLRSLCTIEKEEYTGEFDVGLYAAGIFNGGILVLSGTGSDVFGKYNGIGGMIGGYGSLISDEGSGYWMSRMACEYAIRDYEGRGEKTLLTEMILEHRKEKEMHKALGGLYHVPNTAPTTAIASLSILVEKAALAGDAVALRIIDAAAESMASQTIAMIKLYGYPAETPITISGSAWKTPGMYSKFEKIMREYDPDLNIILPEFEPIMGPIIKDYYDKFGKFDDEAKAKFKKEYPQYIFSINK
ncbi:MAG: hypothetical protein IJ325_02395 [Clostridia bacterium]|nr:hypothetical protein [Clostridia bacterium]